MAAISANFMQAERSAYTRNQQTESTDPRDTRPLPDPPRPPPSRNRNSVVDMTGSDAAGTQKRRKGRRKSSGGGEKIKDPRVSLVKENSLLIYSAFR